MGDLRPDHRFARTSFIILHELNCRPRTWVVSPQLAPNPPHVYRSDDDSLCLYLAEGMVVDAGHVVGGYHRPMVGALVVLLRSLAGHRRVARTRSPHGATAPK